MGKNDINIEFDSQGFCLKGKLHLPSIKHPPLVVGSHGLEGSMESAKQVVLSKHLAENNIAFFRFDHRGCGRSEGSFVNDTSLEKRTRDLICAITHIHTLGKTGRQTAVFGSSMGGAACINAWETLVQSGIDLCGGVLCSAPLKSLTIKKIPTKANGSRPALPLSFFARNLLFDLTDKAEKLSNVMIFHGDADEVVPVDNAYRIFDLAKAPKKLIVHKKGDHQMTSHKDQNDFEQKAVAWFLRCFGL